MKIQLELTPRQIQDIRKSRADAAAVINAGRCCAALDVGIDVIGLHGLLRGIDEAITEATTQKK